MGIFVLQPVASRGLFLTQSRPQFCAAPQCTSKRGITTPESTRKVPSRAGEWSHCLPCEERGVYVLSSQLEVVLCGLTPQQYQAFLTLYNL